ncbi:MAG: protein-methionine-sulfoxide reductase heme-binding subunit MsrQ [Pseudomonadota bacterium]
MTKTQKIRWIAKPLVFVTGLLPAIWIAALTVLQPSALGANPVEALLDHFGIWAMWFMLIALAVTPVRKLLGWPSLARFRRMIGLFAFFYVLMHFLTWLVLDQGLALGPILEDIAKRPFITIGIVAFVLLLAMAATSFTRLRQRMGRAWQTLHNSVYLVGVLGVWHYWWQVRADFAEPLLYAVILTALLGYRVADQLRKPARRVARA